MSRLVLLVVLATSTFAGCGDGAPGSAREAGREWVKAVNAEDWERACELSADERPGCERATAEGFGDLGRDLRLGRREGDAFALSISPAAEKRSGWLAYAPPVLFVERRGGRYVVHTEVQVIR